VSANMTLKATLRNGADLVVPVNVDVAREAKGVIKRLGPNPLNPETAVSIVLASGGRLRVRVFDVTGRMVRTLLDTASAPAGLTVVRFDGKTQRGVTLSSGRYFVQAETDEGNDVTPLTILK
jgi:flagellar hook assembly protein FlgD